MPPEPLGHSEKNNNKERKDAGGSRKGGAATGEDRKVEVKKKKKGVPALSMRLAEGEVFVLNTNGGELCGGLKKKKSKWLRIVWRFKKKCKGLRIVRRFKKEKQMVEICVEVSF